MQWLTSFKHVKVHIRKSGIKVLTWDVYACRNVYACSIYIIITDGVEMECNFEEIYTSGNILTKYHSIDVDPDREATFISLSYGSWSVLDILLRGSTCFQTFDQLCQPWIQDLYDLDINETTIKNSHCRCLRITYAFDNEVKMLVYLCSLFLLNKELVYSCI